MTVLLLTFVLACAPKIGPLQGQIINDQGKPLKGVQVKIEGIEAKGLTNQSGRFDISAPLDKETQTISGDQSLLITLVGYEPVRLTMPIPHKKHTIKKPIVLKSLQIKVPYRRKNLDLYKNPSTEAEK